MGGPHICLHCHLNTVPSVFLVYLDNGFFASLLLYGGHKEVRECSCIISLHNDVIVKILSGINESRYSSGMNLVFRPIGPDRTMCSLCPCIAGRLLTQCVG